MAFFVSVVKDSSHGGLELLEDVVGSSAGFFAGEGGLEIFFNFGKTGMVSVL